MAWVQHQRFPEYIYKKHIKLQIKKTLGAELTKAGAD
jgi:hypothetical protein